MAQSLRPSRAGLSYLSHRQFTQIFPRLTAAAAMRRPLVSLAGLSLQRRQFTQISPRWAGAAAGIRQPQAVRPSQRAEKSIKVLQKEQMAQGMLPSDMGLLGQTFVPPIITFSSIFKTPTVFFRLHYNRLKYRFRNFTSLLYIKGMSPRGERWYNRSFKIKRRDIQPVAVTLHKQMYSAFAEGDVQGLREICTDGVYDSLRTRIGGRRRGEKLAWELVKYNRSPKVVSDYMLQIPGVAGGALRQAIVRICSQQKLTRYVAGVEVDGTGIPRDVVEYVVVQNKMEKWAPGEWRVWGTTKETTLKDVETWKRNIMGEK